MSTPVPVKPKTWIIHVDLKEGQDFRLPAEYADLKAALAESAKAINTGCVAQKLESPERWLVHPITNVKWLLVQEKEATA